MQRLVYCFFHPNASTGYSRCNDLLIVRICWIYIFCMCSGQTDISVDIRYPRVTDVDNVSYPWQVTGTGSDIGYKSRIWMSRDTIRGYFTRCHPYFQGTYVRPGNSWDLRSCRQQPGESLRDYIWRFSKQRTELPNITDSDVIGAFLAGTTLNRFLLLRARPVGGPGIWWRRRDLGSRGERSPGK